jgi:hypothetical protein
MGDYIPSAPIDDEARKRNKNLPGMGGVFNYANLHVYHYAGNNPVLMKDPNGREVDLDFVVTHIEETNHGIMVSGDLTITDRDTGESKVVRAYSGGLGSDPNDGVSLPIPLGEYDILEIAPRGYRLEARDSNYGNDVVDGVNPSQGLLRLHGPGGTYGCLAVGNVNERSDMTDWNSVSQMLGNTRISEEVQVSSKNLGGIAGFLGVKEPQQKYGTLTVRSIVPIIPHARMK